MIGVFSKAPSSLTHEVAAKASAQRLADGIKNM